MAYQRVNPEATAHIPRVHSLAEAQKRGRPPGSINLRTKQAAAYAREVVEDPAYRAKLMERARNGELGSMEPILWAYAYGKPIEQVKLMNADGSNALDLSTLSAGELAQRALHLHAVLQAAAEAQQEKEAMREAEAQDAIPEGSSTIQ